MIPIYRAKKIDSDEYATGFLNMAFDYGNYEEEDVEEPEKKYFLIQFMDNESSDTDMWSFNGFNEIDISTLAIHFPDMLDSQGNKIFASLSEDGKGGDIFQYNNFTAYRELDNAVNTVVINQGRYALLIGDNFHSIFAIQGKVIGIQQ